VLESASFEGHLTSHANPLTLAQVAELERQGFLVIDTPQINKSEIEWCRGILMRLIQRGTGRKDGRSFDIAAREGGDGRVSLGLFRPSLYSSELSGWSFRNIGLQIARQLLGPDTTLAADNTVFKPKRVGGPTPLHQDEAYNDPLHYERQVTIWIAMSDTTVENGAMAFIPGSHLLGILPHRLHGGREEANAIECCSGFDPATQMVCPIPAGGMTIHLGRTVHGASFNTSDSDRLGYILNYKTPPLPRPELGEFAWNAKVARAIHGRRRRWLLGGGIFREVLRFIFADRDNKRFFFKRLRKRLAAKQRADGEHDSIE
jgi:hypothetical protein